MRLFDMLAQVCKGAPLIAHQDNLKMLSACLMGLGFIPSYIRALEVHLEHRGTVMVWIVALFDKNQNKPIPERLEIIEAL